jgi:hypothetical protein
MIDGLWPGEQPTDNENKMNIDRHNYEEYFILYMDNELGSDDRRQVEEFIQKHPDLKEELEVLLQYKMVPDTDIVFHGKDELKIHDGFLPISMANYEEWLTMYIDNELTPKQRTAVEQFVAANQQVKKELEILQQTKLQPEEIIFTDKESLYRREEKVRMISMRRWRIAAAAVLILTIGTTAIIVLNKKSLDTGIVIAPGKVQKINNGDSPVIKEPDNHPVIVKSNRQDNIKNLQQTNIVTGKRNNTAGKKLPVNLPVPVKKEEPIIAKNNEKPSNNLPQPLNNNVISDPTKTDIAVNTPQEKNNPKISLTDGPVTTDSPQPSNVVYNDLNQSDGKKGKLRGFLRKVTRTFEKNTNINAANDDDRVLIGGLALKLK